MKGPSLHQGTAGHATQLRVNRTMDNTSVADGRAGSSPFQAATDKDKIKWDKEKKVSETKTRNTKGGENTKTDYETKGTSKGAKVEKKATTPEEIAKYKKYKSDVASGKVKRNTKYDDKTHTKGRSETSSTESNMKKIPPVGPKTVKKSNEPKVDIQEPTRKAPKGPRPSSSTRRRKKKKINWRQTGLRVRNAVRKVNPIRAIKKACKGETCYSN